MVLARWQPFTNAWDELDLFRGEMDRLLNRFGLAERTWPSLSQAFPPMNVWEDEENVYLEAELPGMQLEHLEIFGSEGDQLTIQGERVSPRMEKAAWHRQERAFGKFHRTLTLPFPVDFDRVEARLENGVLLVKLPKREEAKPRRIAVKNE